MRLQSNIYIIYIYNNSSLSQLQTRSVQLNLVIFTPNFSLMTPIVLLTMETVLSICAWFTVSTH